MTKRGRTRRKMQNKQLVICPLPAIKCEATIIESVGSRPIFIGGKHFQVEIKP